jgi:hypothetical protein
MKVRIHTDLFSGIGFLVLAVVLLIVIPQEVKVVTDESVNSRTFPYLIALLLMVMSLKTIAVSVRSILRKEEKGYVDFDLKVELKALIFILLLVLYVVLMRLAGYLAASLVMAGGFLLLFRSRSFKYYAIVLACTVAVYLIFKLALNVQLPSIGW